MLAVAAIVFTGGAALGLPALAGGFGGAVSSALGAVGITGSGAIGSALTGAVTQAGYGAALGGLVSTATGGSFTDGAATGALAGAVTGGISGALGAGAAPAGGVTASSRTMPAGLGGAATPMPRPAGLATNLVGATPPPVVPPPVAPPMAPVAAAAPSGLGAIAGNIIRSPIVGQTIAGLGRGLLGGMAEKEAIEAEKEEQERRTSSFDLGAGAYDAMPEADVADRPTPREKWQRPRYRYSRDERRITYE